MSMLKGKKGGSTLRALRAQRSFLVCDAEDCIQVGVGVLGVGLGCGVSVLAYQAWCYMVLAYRPRAWAAPGDVSLPTRPWLA
jgi:hypothetical protein